MENELISIHQKRKAECALVFLDLQLALGAAI